MSFRSLASAPSPSQSRSSSDRSGAIAQAPPLRPRLPHVCRGLLLALRPGTGCRLATLVTAAPDSSRILHRVALHFALIAIFPIPGGASGFSEMAPIRTLLGPDLLGATTGSLIGARAWRSAGLDDRGGDARTPRSLQLLLALPARHALIQHVIGRGLREAFPRAYDWASGPRGGRLGALASPRTSRCDAIRRARSQPCSPALVPTVSGTAVNRSLATLPHPSSALLSASRSARRCSPTGSSPRSLRPGPSPVAASFSRLWRSSSREERGERAQARPHRLHGRHHIDAHRSRHGSGRAGALGRRDRRAGGGTREGRQLTPRRLRASPRTHVTPAWMGHQDHVATVLARDAAKPP